MNRNTATSFALSFLLVAVTAVVFYQPDRLPPRLGEWTKRRQRFEVADRRPTAGNGIGTHFEITARHRDIAPFKSKNRTPTAAKADFGVHDRRSERIARRRRRPRVWSRKSADVLLRANRDQLDSLDEKLPVGTILRTPEANDK